MPYLPPPWFTTRDSQPCHWHTLECFPNLTGCADVWSECEICCRLFLGVVQCPPSSPALALTLALTPGGKWCRPTDPTMMILSARHTLLITLLILSAHRVDYCADTLLITRHQFDTFSKAHTSAPAWRGEPPCKKEHLKHYKAVCVMLCWYFQQGTPCFYCVETALILC